MGQGQTSNYPLILSYLTLRRIIGWIAVLLPFVLVAARLLFRKQFNIPVQWPDSASGFYYTGMRDVFVGSVCALGVFLLAYRGRDRVDFWVTFAAGVCAIGVALFPTKPTCLLGKPNCVTHNQSIVGDIHDVFAIALLMLMGVMALRFAKSAFQTYGENQTIVKRILLGLGFVHNWSEKNGKKETAESTRLKRQRNHWFRWCAGITLVCATLFLLQAFTPLLDWPKSHIRVFLLLIETIAILSFGTAWFVKGRSLLPFHRNGLLHQRKLTDVADVVHGEFVRSSLGDEGKSAGEAAKELGISRQRVSEIAAEIT